MIEFRQLPDDHPDLAHSPLLRAALLTLHYAERHGAIELTETKAFKRVFVHWAAEHFAWPGMSHEDLFRFYKVLNECEFQPLELLHFLLISLKLGRHYKNDFRITKRGVELARSPAKLFERLIPFYVLRVDHAAYSRFDGRPLGNWDVWLNVLNAEVDMGASEQELYAAFYGGGADQDRAGWRDMAAFSSCVLRPLEWSGLLACAANDAETRFSRHLFKTPLWRSALKLDTDTQLTVARLH